MASEEGVPVDLYIYDLTSGLASVLSPAILGHQIDGVWHTSIVVFDREYFYGGGGVTSCAPGSTALGAPRQTERLGTTFVPFQLFLDYLQTLATSTYTGAAYHLLEHNCNHFSDEVAQFLCGARVPKHIVGQADVLPPSLRAPIAALLDSAAPHAAQVMYGEGALARRGREDSPEFLTLNNQIEEARLQSAELEQRRNTLAEKLARKERKKEKKRKKLLKEQQRLGITGEGDQLEDDDEMAECLETVQQQQETLESNAGPSVDILAEEREERRKQEEQRRSRDPPIVYKDLDGAQEFEKLLKAFEKVELTEEEKASVEELRQYLVAGEGSWVLGDEFLAFIGRLLQDPSLSSECRVSALRCMACCALRDDVSLILHQDRRHHAIMNYAQQVDSHPLEEQCALTLFMCNLFENISSSEWLLYISEWEANGQPLSNIRATTKVAVHAILSEDPTLRDLGTALMHNVATKEVKTVVFDEICVELCMALLQVLGGAPGEEHLFRACKALARLAHHSSEVPQLVAMVGPHPNAFRGTSPRVDEQIDLIEMKVK